MGEELKTYDERTHELLENPDLSLGYTYPGSIIVGYTGNGRHVLEGSKTERNPEGFEVEYESLPIIERCLFFHRYSYDNYPGEPKMATVEYVDEQFQKAVTNAVKLAKGG